MLQFLDIIFLSFSWPVGVLGMGTLEWEQEWELGMKMKMELGVTGVILKGTDIS